MSKFALIVLGLGMAFPSYGELVVYTDRPQARFAEAAKDFSQQTGEKVTFLEVSYKNIAERLEKEGEHTPADLVITKDLVYFHDLKSKGYLQSFENSAVVQGVPAFMRAQNNEWVALSFRARTAVFDPNLVSRSELTTYADLANPKWAGSLCLRTSQASYNEALVGGLILKHSLEQTKEILKGWVNNMASAPMRDDTEILNKVAQGECLVGIVNHYYYAGLKAQNPDFPVEIAFLDQAEGGVLTNGTGVALLKTADDKALAQKFLEILLSEKNQLIISGAHYDFPAVESVIPDTFIKDWGPFKKNPLSWDEIGQNVEAARDLVKEVGYE